MIARMKKVRETIASFFVLLGVISVIALLLTLPVYWLWNWLIPVIFKLPKITMFQAFGLLLLSCFLFRSYGGFRK